MQNFISIIKTPFITALAIFALLFPVSHFVTIYGNSMLLLPRFVPGSELFEIVALMIYGGILTHLMIKNQAKFRLISWTLFSLVFFGQLLLGILAEQRFLMSGMLHVPLPAYILGGSLYKGEIGFMVILLLSTIALSGPAWCSHLCYFGALDNLASMTKKRRTNPVNLKLKATIAILFMGAILLFRLFEVDHTTSTIFALSWGFVALLVMIFLSPKKSSMMQCRYWCPTGLIVNITSQLYPIKMRINKNCDSCYRCTSSCKFGALTKKDIADQKPGFTCTNCGDCLSHCHVSALNYKLFRYEGESIRKLWIVLTVTLHVVFLALARI